MEKRFDCNGKLLTAGSRVRLISVDERYGNAFVSFFLKNKIYGVVCSDNDHDNYWAPNRSSMVAFTNIPEISVIPRQLCQPCLLEIIPEEEYEQYDKYLADGKLAAVQLLSDIRAIMTAPKPTINFNHRRFNFEDKFLLDTNLNAVELGFWDKSDGRNVFHVHETNFKKTCCSFTKTTSDLQVYIPKIWLQYYGYLTYDLVEWLQFLSKCEIGFEYEFLGETGLSSYYDTHLPSDEAITRLREKDQANDQYRYNIYPGYMASVIVPLGKDGYYCVRLKASDNDHQTYLRFICLRYIYNSQYWSIPGHAMQIKRALGEEVTHWQALLMAHLHYPYYYYYSLGLQVDLNPLVKHDRYGDKTNPFSDGNNYDRHVYPFQDVNVLLERIRTGIGMNLSMEYICDAYKREDLRRFFALKDYVGLYLYLTAKDVSKDEKQWRLLQPIKAQE